MRPYCRSRHSVTEQHPVSGSFLNQGSVSHLTDISVAGCDHTVQAILTVRSPGHRRAQTCRSTSIQRTPGKSVPPGHCSTTETIIGHSVGCDAPFSVQLRSPQCWWRLFLGLLFQLPSIQRTSRCAVRSIVSATFPAAKCVQYCRICWQGHSTASSRPVCGFMSGCVRNARNWPGG